MRRLDIRRLARCGVLRPDFYGQWHWLLRDKVVASISIRTEPDRLILTYRHQRHGSDWKNERYPVELS